MAPRVDFDQIVTDERFRPWCGWHDDQIMGQPYQPAMQQVRSEFMAFARLLEERELTDKCLQIGLGTIGASHLAFEGMFREAWTIDRDASAVNRFLLRIDGDHHIIVGDSRQDETIGRARQIAPFDVLFIDGDHGYREVSSDYLRYGPMVRQGGIIAFHDAACQEYEVFAFLNDLRSSGLEVNVIGSHLGIGWICK